jgi:hypothetical protein
MLFFFVESSVRGTLNPDGTLQLDEPLTKLQPGPVEVIIRQRSSQERDWWKALQEVFADQKSRGFVGTVTDVDRGDEGYEDRMREIYENTNRDSTNG